MTLNQLQTLTEDEIAMMCYVVNVISHPGIPKIEFTPQRCTWFRDGVLVDKLMKALILVEPEGRNTYLSLLAKLGEKTDICQTQTETSGSLEASTNTETGSLST